MELDEDLNDVTVVDVFVENSIALKLSVVFLKVVAVVGGSELVVSHVLNQDQHLYFSKICTNLNYKKIYRICLHIYQRLILL
jgi:hypothetical protein